jgi:hypothetical protein
LSFFFSVTNPSLNLTWDEHTVRLRFTDAGHSTFNSTLNASFNASFKASLNASSNASLNASPKASLKASLKASTYDWIFRYRVYQRFMDERDFEEANFIDQLSRFLMQVIIFMFREGSLIWETTGGGTSKLD